MGGPDGSYFEPGPDFGRGRVAAAPGTGPGAGPSGPASIGIGDNWALERLGVWAGGLAAIFFLIAPVLHFVGTRAGGAPPRDAAGLLTWAASHPGILESIELCLSLGWLAASALATGLGQRLHRAGSDLAIYCSLAGVLGSVILALGLGAQAATLGSLARASAGAAGPERAAALMLFEWAYVWVCGLAFDTVAYLLVAIWLLPSGWLILRSGALSRPLGLASVLAAVAAPLLGMPTIFLMAAWCAWAAYELAAAPPHMLL
ncbi:MAG: DUF4386 family protein [Chloroflexi bacterium]|nr:DUF4386 family protein [Chloroflexota bacterium]